jgi:hypothetical protein
MTTQTQTGATTVEGIDYAARGLIGEVQEGQIVFQPHNTNYQLHLKTTGRYAGPVGVPVQGIIRLQARKIYSVSSGGSWVAPIVGTPRTVQGRVKYLSPIQLVVQAGTTFVVELPPQGQSSEGLATMELAGGPIAISSLVNVVALPGASFEYRG